MREILERANVQFALIGAAAVAVIAEIASRVGDLPADAQKHWAALVRDS